MAGLPELTSVKGPAPGGERPSGPRRGPRSAEELEEERRLVEAAKKDPAAFAKLYDRYVDSIHAYVYHQTGSWERAEDVTATTFMRAYAEIGKFEWRGVPYSAWLYRVASNLVLRDHRHPGWIELPEGLVDPGEGPEEAAVRSEQVRRVQAAVRRLSPDQRQAITLRFGSGLRNAEVAQVMGKSEGAVKLLVFRALRSLEKRLGPDFEKGFVPRLRVAPPEPPEEA
jgi:RNA polymerase sigma-70 factor (ECF subfamily)